MHMMALLSQRQNMHSKLCCKFKIWMRLHVNFAAWHKTAGETNLWMLSPPLTAAISHMQMIKMRCDRARWAFTKSKVWADNNTSVFFLIHISLNGRDKTALLVAVNNRNGLSIWASAVNTQSCCSEKDICSPAYGSGQQRICACLHGKGELLLTIAHHVFVWEEPGSRRQQAECLHSWHSGESSNNICWLHNV